MSVTDRDKKISVTSFAKRPEKSMFIFASVIFLMLRICKMEIDDFLLIFQKYHCLIHFNNFFFYFKSSKSYTK